MEDILRPIYQEHTNNINTSGIVMIGRQHYMISNNDKFDAILLIIVKKNELPIMIEHYLYKGKKIAVHTVTEEQLSDWLLLGSNRKVTEWILSGQILFDQNKYLFNLKKDLKEFPYQDRKLKMGLEFAKLIRRYIDGKRLFENKHYLDAYNYILHSLHHLGRLAIIEKGFHHEVTVWNQVKQIEPEIFKLYYELVCSDEQLEKRLELLLLASDFFILSKAKIGSSHLLEVLNNQEHWTSNDILNHPNLNLYSIDLEVLLNYLIDKKFIETINVETKIKGMYNSYYKVPEKIFYKNNKKY